MDYNSMETQVKRSREKDFELANLITEKNSAWLRYLVTTISVVFGIMVSLSPMQSNNPRPIRLCFALGLILFALSLLYLGASLYAELYYIRKGRILHAEETRKAYQESRPTESVPVPTRKIFVFLELAGYTCSALALLVLCVYMSLQVFFP